MQPRGGAGFPGLGGGDILQVFQLEPKGVHEIKVCLGTACHLKGGARLVESLERELKVERGHTTRDLQL